MSVLIFGLLVLVASWFIGKLKEFLQRLGILKTEVFIPEMTIDEMYAGKTDEEIRDAIWAKDEDDLTSDESIYKFAITLADEQRAGGISEDEIQEIQISIGISEEEMIENVKQNLR